MALHCQLYNSAGLSQIKICKGVQPNLTKTKSLLYQFVLLSPFQVKTAQLGLHFWLLTKKVEMYHYRDLLKDTVLGSNAVKDRRRRKVQQLISFKPTTSRLKGSSSVPQLLPHWNKRYDRAEVQLSLVSVSHPGPTSKYPTGDFR